MEFDVFTSQAVRRALEKCGLSPQKYLGQNFLLSADIAKQIAQAVEVKGLDNIVEVGSGLGILTNELLRKNIPLLAIEKDPRLARYAQASFIFPRLQVKEGDILSLAKIFPWDSLHNYSVVSNLPYQITSRFLKIFLSEIVYRPKQLVLMLQAEVAEKLVAPVGALTKLSLLAQVYAEPKVLFKVPANFFYPSPKVNSAVVSLKLKTTLPFIFPQDEDLFWRLVRIGFASRRKTLSNNLANGLHLQSIQAQKMLKLAKLDLKIRAQALAVADWLKMVDIYKKIY